MFLLLPALYSWFLGGKTNKKQETVIVLKQDDGEVLGKNGIYLSSCESTALKENTKLRFK